MRSCFCFSNRHGEGRVGRRACRLEHRSLEGKRYAYWWVDGVYTNLRAEEQRITDRSADCEAVASAPTVSPPSGTGAVWMTPELCDSLWTSQAGYSGMIGFTMAGKLVWRDGSVAWKRRCVVHQR
ncbi:protein of unknown function [Acidithiobacillus ferrivorans]|uniref:Uncharacterized protein n=1 Tax=Acidithiobacillus ferrivorans TaxID=160808 RepID=A0A060UNE5_9PROT|nr:hypothetical protein AFERRI_370064 [Acidithiobacillus ferrivorans]SMH65711.1 protein of unknown function [Acidithiobacillus ferrivorans]